MTKYIKVYKCDKCGEWAVEDNRVKCPCGAMPSKEAEMLEIDINATIKSFSFIYQVPNLVFKPQ